MSNFDRVAHQYRVMETLSFGTKLQQCRTSFIEELNVAGRVLILGEGDGRFVKELLLRNKHAQVDVVDSSVKMLALTQRRIEKVHAQTRCRLIHMDALNFQASNRYDAIVTNFFLDCLTDEKAQSLVSSMAKNLRPDGIWIVGDFTIPAGKNRYFAKAIVMALYLAFRVLAGLRVYRLPKLEDSMERAGLIRIKQRHSLGGLLCAELWKKQS